MNDLEHSIVALYVVMATTGALALAYVLRQAINDNHLSRTDPPRVRSARKAVFGISAYFLLLTVFFRDRWLVHPSLIAVGIVVIGFMVAVIMVLAVNMVSFRLRQTPIDGAKMRIPDAIPARLRGRRYS